MKYLLLNEKGSVLNIALLIVILLSLVGLGISRVATLDNKIGINVKRTWNRFYEAEGVLREASQWLEVIDTDVLKNKSQPGLYNESDLRDLNPNYDNDSNGKIDDYELVLTPDSQIMPNASYANYSADGWPESSWTVPDTPPSVARPLVFTTIDYGIAKGSSVVMSNPSHLHQFVIASRYMDEIGETIIKSGYLKRF
jgi:hypothetical protein